MLFQLFCEMIYHLINLILGVEHSLRAGVEDMNTCQMFHCHKRKQIFLKYNSILSQNSWAILPTFTVNNRKSSCHLYQLRIEGFEEQQRDELISRLASIDIGVNVHYIPLPMLSYFKSIGLDIKDFPSSYNLYKNEISLPIYNDLAIESVEYVCEKLSEIVNEIIK